jgi:hypothetical protein
MEFVCKDDPRPLIPEAVYEAVCTDYDPSFCFGKSRKLFLNFKIISGSHLGKELFMAFNMAYNGKMALGSKYYKTWCMVNDWKPPSRNAIISPRIFKNKVFEVLVRKVKPQHNGNAMPKDFHYSVVDSIVKVNTGINNNG